MKNPMREYAEKIETLENPEAAISQAASALTYGLTVSVMAAMTDSRPVLIFSRINLITGEVEAVHPDSPEPIFEPAAAVLRRMADEAEKNKVRPGTIH